MGTNKLNWDGIYVLFCFFENDIFKNCYNYNPGYIKFIFAVLYKLYVEYRPVNHNIDR